MIRSFLVATAAVLMLSCLPAFSQTLKVPAPPAKPAAPATSPAPAPTLTELEKTKLENLQLKFSMLQQQQTDLQNQYQALIQGIVAEHPGFQWNPQSSSLIPKPAPAPAEKK